MTKIPEIAKKVFTGKIFDVYQWEQELYNGNKKTFEMLKRNPTVDIISIIDDKIVILKQEQPTKPLFNSMPGGAIDQGEDPIDAAKRELMEETGMICNSIKIIREYFGSSKMYFHEYLMLATGCKKVSEQKLDGGEKIDVTEVDFDKFLSLCRKPMSFTAPIEFKFEMYEALLDPLKYNNLKNELFIY